MHYYTNLSNSKFSKLKLKIKKLENEVIRPFCGKNSFSQDKERYYEESLAVNLYREIDGIKDHIGFYYIDQKGEVLFEFYCTKYYDTIDRRFSHKESLGKMNFEALNENLFELLYESLRKLESLSKSDLKDVTEILR